MRPDSGRCCAHKGKVTRNIKFKTHEEKRSKGNEIVECYGRAKEMHEWITHPDLGVAFSMSLGEVGAPPGDTMAESSWYIICRNYIKRGIQLGRENFLKIIQNLSSIPLWDRCRTADCNVSLTVHYIRCIHTPLNSGTSRVYSSRRARHVVYAMVHTA